MAQISTSQLARLLRRVGTSLRAGVEARWVFQREASQGGLRQQQEMGLVAERVGRGETVAGALRATDGYFPPMAIEMIDVGEQSGRLDEVLLRLADHYDHLLSLRRMVILALFWPALQLSMALFVIGLLIWILGALTPPGAQPTRIFGLTGTSGLVIYLLVVGSTVGGVGLLVTSLLRGWLGPGPLQVALRLPVVGRTLELASLARLAWSLAIALEAGMSAKRSIEMALRSTSNPLYTQHVEQVARQVQDGCELHESLRGTGRFPREFLDILETAEHAGTHTESLNAMARDYSEQAATSLTLLVRAVCIGIWLLVCGFIVYMIFTLLFQLYINPIRELLHHGAGR